MAQVQHSMRLRDRVVSPTLIEIRRTHRLSTRVLANDLDDVCEMLYYGADVYKPSYNSITPLKNALIFNCKEISQVLFNYYDNIYFTSLSMGRNNIPGKEIVLNVQHEATALLANAFHNKDIELARLFVQTVKFEEILNEDDSNLLLAFLIQPNDLPPKEWCELLFFLLNIFVKKQFIIRYTCIDEFTQIDTFFGCLLQKKNLEPDIRLRIINLCLSLGALVCIEDLAEAHKVYGYEEELEALIYSYNCEVINDRSSSFIYFILSTSENFSTKAVSRIFKSLLHVHARVGADVDYAIGVLGFISLPEIVKQEIRDECRFVTKRNKEQVYKKLEKVAEFPTLIELSRNEARKLIRENNRIKFTFHFLDAVRKLKYPTSLKNVILYKRPVF